MSFEEEWNQLKADALRRRETSMALASADGRGGGGGVAAPQNGDLGLRDAPIRAKASGLRVANGEARGKTKLDDALAAAIRTPTFGARRLRHVHRPCGPPDPRHVTLPPKLPRAAASPPTGTFSRSRRLLRRPRHRQPVTPDEPEKHQ
ncbi:hypothetical protein SLA_7059 [Streptomyces laurentii]|uniref:Uncharacterized protein n=1 Tax=Streptomyces laurentii TaxID=39478 RepID=A0A160P9B6_STRLU|nr:hypothetical protein SLA_7059 [Streptomyces laurentii]